jgi:hypothetical protein
MDSNFDEIKKEDYLVIVFDVLGFSSYLNNLGLEDVYKTYVKLINDSVSGDTTWARGTFNLGGRTALVLLAESPVKFANFSDSVLLWLKDLNANTINITFQKLNELICQSIEIDFPLRGGISFGEALIDKSKSIYIGQPIISCVRAESNQEWIGASLAYDWDFGIPIYPDTIIPYTKHIKKGENKYFCEIVLDFPRHWRTTRATSIVDKLNELKTKAIAMNGPAHYYDNTIEFCEFSESMHDVRWEIEWMERKNKEYEEQSGK